VRQEREFSDSIQELNDERIGFVIHRMSRELVSDEKRFTMPLEDLCEKVDELFSEYPQSHDIMIVLDNLMRCETENINDLTKEVIALIDKKIMYFASYFIQV
jgi:hypothetical protein